MGEFNDCVSSLLDAFAQGTGIIKVQRRRRKETHRSIDSNHKNAETKLSKSLKKDRLQVKDAYGRDLSRYGHHFAAGDAEAHSCLSAILFRLNAGFVSVIERFTKGRSSPADYQTLLNLSKSSRIEAINTFSQLSSRLSRSSLTLVPANKHSTSRSRNKHKRKSSKAFSGASHSSKNSRSKAAPDLSITALGPATSDGWVRPKSGRKSTSSSTTKHSSGSSTPRRSKSKGQPQSSPQASPQPASSPKTIIFQDEDVPTPMTTPTPTPRSRSRVRTRPDNCKSIMSIASGSTKIGEIPDHKWVKPSMFESGEAPNYPVTVFYPMGVYQEPEKPRSRFARLFRR